MKLIVPYADLKDETDAFCIRHDGYPVRMVTPYSYGYLFFSLWQRQEPFVICEHDIVPTDDDWNDLTECPKAWCAYKYDSLGTAVQSLGFSKFDPARMPLVHFKVRDVKWDELDTQVWNALQSAGYGPHVHDRWVRHLRAPRGKEQYNDATVFPVGAITQKGVVR